MRHFIFCGVVIVSSWLFTMPAFAATLSVHTSPQELHIGDEVRVMLIANTNGDTINAVEGEVQYPSTLLKFVSADDSHSVVSLWVESPQPRDAETIAFSGVVPGGFMQTDAELVTLVFEVVAAGEGDVTWGAATSMLLNDGAGTPSKLVAEDFPLRVSPGEPNARIVVTDDELPEPFTPMLLRDPDVFEGAPSVLFSTTDKGSGMDHYEVAEGYWGRYRVASSPYRITHDDPTIPLYVKAVDRSGNERVAVFYPHNERPWYRAIPIDGTIFVFSGFVLCLFLFVFVRFVRTGRFLFWR